MRQSAVLAVATARRVRLDSCLNVAMRRTPGPGQDETLAPRERIFSPQADPRYTRPSPHRASLVHEGFALQ
jgi:hypothetical protein